MILRTSLFSALGIGIFLSGGIIHYDFKHPDAHYILPDSLLEISGLTDVDDGRIGCVQDEKGIVFIYDLYQSRIQSQHTFYLDGDYEGISLAKSDMYVLRSNGTLFRIGHFMEQKTTVDSFETHIRNTDNEGLCYDARHNQLLIASKNRISHLPELKDKRFVYGFDLVECRTKEDPLLVIDVAEIEQKMKESGVEMGYRVRPDGTKIPRKVKFMPSSIAIHPLTGEYYILSATDHLLVVINAQARIQKVEKLGETLFPKPEGLTFFSNGDLFISNEGKNGEPSLLRFNYKP